ncbi:CAZyme family CE10 [Penicillium malachiteum]|uniref:Carboxylic ester hydrolase n=1 Tax=Penicillium malachiteum TaxID=1324776 RepID=A0AAD6MUL5_9EURO|nr:CAZyme family CE10 [Penicillium malachiteum]
MDSMASRISIISLFALSTLTCLAKPVQTSPIVDLDYATYQGYYSNTYGLNIYKGIRYAAPPVGKLRWQAPQAPLVNRSSIQSAIEQPPLCPQSGGAKLPEIYGFGSALGDEDCLFLNVYAPPNAKGLPVLLWIHGGGYGVFGAEYDPSEWINTNSNGFIAVMIQYRLGAFGFLASEDIQTYGKVNAGLLDMRFALEWVQKHIKKFGGDASRVTVGGESSGAASAMLQALAYGGREDNLFKNIIAASPYTPAMYQYNDEVPMNHYKHFVSRAGCAQENGSQSAVFECLVSADTVTLQYASANVSISGEWGTWAFQPVVDGEFIQELPSKQLLQKRVSGKRILSGNNANDGVPLSPPYINTTTAFSNYLKSTFPLFNETDYIKLREMYGVQSSTSPQNTSPRYDTLGDHGPTALNQSEMATGLQQTIFNIFAESTFDCPSYWLAEAFSDFTKESWKYQYSVTPAYHGADLTAYFSVGATTPTHGLIHALQKILGTFIIDDTPIISMQDAQGGYDNSTVPEGVNGSISWPMWNTRSPILMNLNTTGGHTVLNKVTEDLSYWLREGPGVTNEFILADATTWEGGRGERCEFWRSVGARVPQ